MDGTADGSEIFVNPLKHVLGYELRRASVAVMAKVAGGIAPLGLTPGQASLIVLVGANPGCTQSAIGRALGAKPANLVPLLNQLAALRIVNREQGSGRTIALSLSDHGIGVLAEVQDALARVEKRFVRGLSAEQQTIAVTLLKQICKNACADQ
jgi:DNA-binding MarR family transcriptional regulator